MIHGCKRHVEGLRSGSEGIEGAVSVMEVVAVTIHFRLGSKKYGKIHVRVIYQYNVTWIGKAMLNVTWIGKAI